MFKRVQTSGAQHQLLMNNVCDPDTRHGDEAGRDPEVRCGGRPLAPPWQGDLGTVPSARCPLQPDEGRCALPPSEFQQRGVLSFPSSHRIGSCIGCNHTGGLSGALPPPARLSRVPMKPTGLRPLSLFVGDAGVTPPPPKVITFARGTATSGTSWRCLVSGARSPSAPSLDSLPLSMCLLLTALSAPCPRVALPWDFVRSLRSAALLAACCDVTAE